MNKACKNTFSQLISQAFLINVSIQHYQDIIASPPFKFLVPSLSTNTLTIVALVIVQVYVIVPTLAITQVTCHYYISISSTLIPPVAIMQVM